MSSDALRNLPAVNVIADSDDLTGAVGEHGREAVVAAARAELDVAREGIRAGKDAPARVALTDAVAERLATRPTLYTSVINGTGVILHTNLGRAPIPEAAWQAMAAAAGTCDLEMDLHTGKRASRLRGVEAPLVAVTGAAAGMVVNNNAAAVLLCLAGLAGTQPTAISRGHMVEIGGGFRLPTIMQASGSPLYELGTTNRTHLRDYQDALDAGAGLILIVHRSNFVMEGYVTEPPPGEIIALAHERGVPVALDLGSGALFDCAARGLPAETTVSVAVAAGYDVVTFSGDKLLGGPQAGYLVGSREPIERLRKHPLARALRCDKVQLAGCVATLELYRRGEAARQVPIWRMLDTDTRARANAWRAGLGDFDGIGAGIGIGIDVVEAAGAVGGGSLPDATLAGHALALSGSDPDALLRALREQTPPVIGHIEKDRVLLHPRTVDPRDDERVIAAVRAAIEQFAPSPVSGLLPDR